MKKSKFILTAGITGASLILPIATVVSCGSNSKADLIIGIRAEDQPYWNNVAAQFKKATGKKVKFKWVQDQNNDYTLWSDSGLMPDISIADSGWAKTGIEKKWFKKIDLPEISTNAKYKITGQDKEYEEHDLKWNGKTFEVAMMDTMKTSGDGYNGLAVIYGPKITYAWKELPIKGGGTYKLFDGRKKLQWYTPSQNEGAEQVTDFDISIYDADNSVLFSKKDDHHRLMNTYDDIQEFLTNSASKSDLKYNNDDIKYDESDPIKRVISTGNLGYSQRLASVSKILYDKIMLDKPDLNSSSARYNNLKIGATQDASIAYGTLAYGDKLIKKTNADVLAAKHNLDDRNVLDDNKVFSNKPDSYKLDFATKSNNKATSKLERLTFFGSLGYFQKGIFGNGIAIDGDDQQVGFANFKSLFVTGGALWMWGGIKAKAENTFSNSGKKADNMLATFGQPFQEANIDGYALKYNISGEREILAKKFLRFLLQPKAAADITSTKAKSTIIAAQNLQGEIVGARANGLRNAGVNALGNDVIGDNTIPFNISKADKATGNLNGHNNDPIYDSYNDFWMKGSAFNKIDYSSEKGLSKKNYTDAIDIYNTKYMDSFIA